ncbi:DUF4747 family protein [Niveispirillum cyanobacteriorum]|uniref:DUF4747 domain-containing protein n=1 Tax=Niveispirillum cyanobacteriorum TaxID=1612173 RepID=A0A2K9NML0_9PROT|nr:DUF4747 family protein [Niveispirillum cyanobacteriorum]AUN33605.1 DUF4747 domain-containing protein [Niveispirillum cyanobacteriorum]GGE47057.1 hypothetical protein GCM10011317_01790 [Niveispirillum cyanobacteriorum]
MRELKLAVGGLNIRLHPHSPEIYDLYIQALYNARTPVRIRGDRFAMITRIDRREVHNNLIKGTIRTFTKIDPNGQWFDEESLDDAKPDLLKQIKIPPTVHPNSASFRFSMNTKNHMLVFENYVDGRQLTPNSAEIIFRRLSELTAIVRKFGHAKITIKQDQSSLERIFDLQRIKSVKFVLEKPNPDIWSDDLEQQVEAHLDAANASRIEIVYKASSGESIEKTDSMDQLGRAALVNGAVEALGYNENGHVKISTLDYPKIEQTKYDPETQSEEIVYDNLRRRMESRL